MRLRLQAWLLALCLVWSLAAPAGAVPIRKVLPSGLTVILEENHEAPVAAFQVWVGAGSALERPGEYGITHLIEHMIFKGSPRFPRGDMAQRIEALGGEVNAYTTLDHTNYYLSIPSRHAALGLEMLAEAVVNASFPPEELVREKEVVIEEIRMNLNHPARRFARAVMRATFGPDHPYGRPVIGSIESVRAITRDHILHYRGRWYTAPNMLVVGVGDFSAGEMLKRIARAFRHLPTHRPPAWRLPPVKLPEGPRLVVLREEVKQARIALTWRIPGLPDPRTYALDMAAAVLGQGEASRLYRQLKEKRGLVDAVSASSYTPRGIGMFQVRATLDPHKLARAWPALLRQSLSLARRPPQEEEMQRARVNLAASFVRDRQAMSDQAQTLGSFQMFYGGYEQMYAYLARFRQMNPLRVAAVVRGQLRPESLAVVVQIPKDAPAPRLEALQETARTLERELPPPPQARPARPTRQVVAGGLTLITLRRSAVPLVSMVLAARGGLEGEPADKPGLSELWARSLTRGTARYSHEELVRILEDMAGELAGFSGKATCGLSGEFLARDWRRGLELMAEVWQSPRFAPEQVARAKAEMAAALRTQAGSPVARAFKAFRRLLYGDHPYGRDPLGSLESLPRLTRDDLRALHRRRRGPKGLVLTVVGDVDPAAVRREVERLWAKDTGAVQVPAVPVVQPPERPRRRLLREPGARQTQVIVGFVAPPARDPRRPALNLLEAVLGGMGGRLFRDLRDRRSLAYAVQPFFSTTVHGGGFGVYMGVGPGKEKEALAGLEEHLAAVRRDPPRPQELARAKSYRVGNLAIARQEYGHLAATMAADELLGLGYDYYLRRARVLEGVSPAQVQAAARTVLEPARRVVLVAGP